MLAVPLTLSIRCAELLQLGLASSRRPSQARAGPSGQSRSPLPVPDFVA